MTSIRRYSSILFLSSLAMLPSAVATIGVAQAQTEPDVLLPSLVVTPDRVPNSHALQKEV